jgi:hypothetical protein
MILDSSRGLVLIHAASPKADWNSSATDGIPSSLRFGLGFFRNLGGMMGIGQDALVGYAKYLYLINIIFKSTYVLLHYPYLTNLYLTIFNLFLT